MRGERNVSIAKNTLFLYFRMICIMLVTLYTSRVVLNVLGATDYGIYQTIGGIVGFLSFVNNALSTGSSRFITYELGRKEDNKLATVFSTLLLAHIILAVCIVVVSEPIGMWYINHKLAISADRIFAAKLIFQFSLLTAFMNITQVPYTAVIIAHENMKIYAYVSLIEVLLKLSVAFAIFVSPIDNLVFYAFLLCVVQFTILLIYRLYCIKFYRESKLDIKVFERSILKEVLAFSGWSLLSSVSCSLVQYGTLLMLTTFFSPILAASRAIADQVTNAVNQFINNFRTAVNPRVVKQYAAGDYEESKKLLLKSVSFSYYLMLLIALPVILLAEPLIKIWLGQVPDYVVPFLQWSMVQGLFAVFDSSFYVPLYAKGQMKENALIAPAIDIVCMVFVFVCLKGKSSPLVISYSYVVMALLQGLIEKPILLCTIVGYRWNEIIIVVLRCALVTLIAVPIPTIIAMNVNTSQILLFLLVCVISSICVVIAAWFGGMDKEDRLNFRNMILLKLLKRRSN